MKEDRSKNLNRWSDKIVKDSKSLEEMKKAVLINMIIVSLGSFLLGIIVATLVGG